jgi:hypothetical protein
MVYCLNTVVATVTVGLSQPCYVMFMAIPSYAYLNLETPGPAGIITLEAKMQRVLDCEQSSIELATTTVTTAEPRELSLQLPMVPLSLEMPRHPAFSRQTRMPRPCRSMPRTQLKPCRSVPTWILNRKASSSTSSNATGTFLCGAQ